MMHLSTLATCAVLASGLASAEALGATSKFGPGTIPLRCSHTRVTPSPPHTTPGCGTLLADVSPTLPTFDVVLPFAATLCCAGGARAGGCRSTDPGPSSLLPRFQVLADYPQAETTGFVHFFTKKTNVV